MKITNEDNMKLMSRYEDNYFDLAIVDPPYGIETKGNAQDRFNMGKDLSLINDAKPNNEYFNELFRVSKNQIIWGYNHLSDMLPKCREFIFWYKHQPVITFSDGELAWTSFLRTAKCFDFPFYKANQANKGYKIHPTQKPVKLYEWLLMNYAEEGDKILDTHLGSGSIAIACHNLGYDLTACELDKEYFDKAIKRITEHQNQQRLF
jgi:site-specific DNA-methyltransferase (adenine-specific)